VKVIGLILRVVEMEEYFLIHFAVYFLFLEALELLKWRNILIHCAIYFLFLEAFCRAC
jgi:hypothetical protein